MATIKYLNRKGHYSDPDSRTDVIKYIFQSNKVKSGCKGYAGVNPNDIVGSMNRIANQFNKAKGVQLRHSVLAFSRNEVSDPYVADEIARKIMSRFGDEYQTVYTSRSSPIVNRALYCSNTTIYSPLNRF